MNLSYKIKIFLFGIVLLFSESVKSQSLTRDNRLLGRWMILFSKDSSGKVLNDGFAGKNYVEVFAKNGTYSIDPNFLRDEAKKNGINEPIDYSAIPSFSWKTLNDETLIIETGQGSQQIRYGFSCDTLLLGYPNGNIQYLLKRK